MKKAIGGLCAFLMSGAAFAGDYYIGHYQCEAPGVAHLGVDGNQVALWWRSGWDYRGISGQVDLSKRAELVTNTYKPGLVLTPKGQEFDAIWIQNDSPIEDCAPFTLEKTQSPLERYEAFLALTGAEGLPDLDRVRDYYAQDFALPPAEMLPELDRKAMEEKVRAARESFAEKIQTARAKAIEEGETGPDYIATSLAWLAPDAFPVDDYNRALGAFAHYLSTIANRAEAAGLDVASMHRRGAAMCETLERFETYPSDDKLVVVSGLPFAFWDRDFAQQVIDDLRGCDAGRHADWVVEHFPEIEQMAAQRQAVLEDLSRFAAMPPRFKTLRETSGFSIPKARREELGLSYRENGDGLTGNGFTLLRAKVMDQARATMAEELDEIIAANADSVWFSDSSACSELFGGLDVPQDIREACAPLAQERIAFAKAQKARDLYAKRLAGLQAATTVAEANDAGWGLPIDGADSLPEAERAEQDAALAKESARLAEVMDNEINALIKDNPQQLVRYTCPSEAALANICRQKVQEHNASVREAECQANMKNAGVTDIADEVVMIEGSEVSFRELACGPIADGKLQISKAGWFSKSRELTHNRAGYPITAVIAPDPERKGIWTITEVKGAAMPGEEDSMICFTRYQLCEQK